MPARIGSFVLTFLGQPVRLLRAVAGAYLLISRFSCFFFFQAEDGIRDDLVTGVQTCALPISLMACSTTTIPYTSLSKLIPLIWIAVVLQAISGFTLWVTKPAQYLGDVMFDTDRKSVVVGKECRSRWSPYH